MASDKHNLILAISSGLISSQFYIASSGDVPFHQPQQLQLMFCNWVVWRLNCDVLYKYHDYSIGAFWDQMIIRLVGNCNYVIETSMRFIVYKYRWNMCSCEEA